MPFARMDLGRSKVERAAVWRHFDVIDLEPAGRELLSRRRCRRGVNGVEMHPAVVLGEEPEALAVRQPALAAVTHPCFVFDVIQYGRLSGRRIDDREPPF